MRKRRVVVFVLMLSAVLLLAWQGTVLAQNPGEQNLMGQNLMGQNPMGQGDKVLPKGVQINDDYFAAGNTVTVDGQIAGDLYAAGANMAMRGDLGGDVLAAGRSLDIGGNVGGNIRAAGSDIIARGKVLRNATIAGQQVTIAPECLITGNALMAAQTVRIDGQVGGSLRAAGTTILIAGEIGRDVVVNANKVVILPGAKIGGNLTYTSATAAEIAPTAQIKGVVKHIPVSPEQAQAKPAVGTLIFRALLGLVRLLLVALVFILLLPRCVKSVAGVVRTQPWLCLGLGFAGLLVPPFVAIILFITVIGSLLGWIVLIGFTAFTAAGFLLGKIVIGFLLGWLILRAVQKQDSVSVIWSVLLGATLLQLVSYIPVLGWIVGLITGVFTLGALLYLAGHTWFPKEPQPVLPQPESPLQPEQT